MPPKGKKRPAPDKRPHSDEKASSLSDQGGRQTHSSSEDTINPEPVDSAEESAHVSPSPPESPSSGIDKDRMFEHGDFQSVRPQRLILTKNSTEDFEANTVIEGEAPSFEPPAPPSPIPIITPLVGKIRALRAALDHRIALAFPNAPKYLIGAITLATALFIAITAAGTGKLVYDRHFAPPKPPEAPPRTATPLPLPANTLTNTIGLQAFAVAKAYIEADGIEAKLPFVRHPEITRPRMQKWYADPRNADLAGSRQVGEIVFRKRLPLANHDAIAIAIDIFPEASTDFFLIEHFPSGEFKIDWESSSGYQPLRFEDLTKSRPTTPLSFRVTARQSDYFNFDFTSDKYDCYRLSYPTSPDFLLYGYVDKFTAVAQQLRLFFPPETNISNSLILDLSYPPDASEADQVIINSIANPHWLED